MTLRTKFLITALFLCHQILASALVTSQLPSGNSAENAAPAQSKTQQKTEPTASDSEKPCGSRAITQLKDGTIICGDQQEKTDDVYKLHQEAEIHYRNYVVRADEMTYNSDTGEATANGHFTLDGGPNDDHIKASHGTYNLPNETGRFYDVTATTGIRFQGGHATEVLTSTAPFAFSGKIVEKTSPDHYLVYEGTITTCELPHPKWQFNAHKVVVDVGANAQIYHSTFWLHGFPIFYFPYATHPVEREVRDTGFLVPTAGRSSTNGTEIGDSFYWVINRSMDATIGAEYFSKRGWSQRGEYRLRPSDKSYLDLSFFGVIDRGISQGAGLPPLKEGGQEARLTAEDNIYGFRAVSNIDYLSSFLFRLAFNEVLRRP
jgi:LPS-assembly protein